MSTHSLKARHQLRHAIDSLYSNGSFATSESYTRLVLECVRANDVVQAKRIQSHMDLHLFQPPDSFLHNRLLHLYAKCGKVSDVRNLFDKMPKRDVFSWNALLSAHSKSGSVQDLKAVFQEMPVRDEVSFNTVVAGFARNGCSREAFEVFVNMQKEGCGPTEYTHVSVLHASSQLVDLRCGKQIHGSVIVRNMLGNVFVYNALTDMYAKCGVIEQARWLFDQCVDRNLVSWNLMISGYVKDGQPEKCIELFNQMRFLGFVPDQVTVSNILSGYVQCGYLDKARKLFDEIKDKDIICWTSMIVGYVQNGREEDALILFSEMLVKDIKPDKYTISIIVSSCAKLASLSHGQVVHGKAIVIGVNDNLLVSSALVDMYSKCGVISDAYLVFKMTPDRNVASWNAMIVGYAQNGHDLDALDLFKNMLQENLVPDNITFVGLLSACIHSSLVEKGQEYFDSIRNQHRMIPTLDHYACMINLLGRSGLVSKAVDLIKDMPHEPNHLIWSSLLSVCTKKGDIANAEMAAKHLFELDPLNAGPYIMLSNMYASYGRWKDVAYMRSLMKKKDVKKFAAYSWIEMDNKVHKFVSEDRSHPETEEIYEELNRLINKLQEAGFSPDTKLVLHDVGEDEKLLSICYHSEKLALAFALVKKPDGRMPIRIIKNIRICGDCHVFMKFVSKITGRLIILRDSNRFHHFSEGKCSCQDSW